MLEIRDVSTIAPSSLRLELSKSLTNLAAAAIREDDLGPLINRILQIELRMSSQYLEEATLSEVGETQSRIDLLEEALHHPQTAVLVFQEELESTVADLKFHPTRKHRADYKDLLLHNLAYREAIRFLQSQT